MLIDKNWLRSHGACWSPHMISAMGCESMTLTEVIADSRISSGDKQWVVTRALIDKSPNLVAKYAKFCAYKAKEWAATNASAAVHATDADADANASASTDYATSAAVYAARAAAYAAHAAHAANANATYDAAHSELLAHALTLMEAN